MPVDISLLGDDGKRLFREWKTKVEKHNKYTVRGKYFKEQRMDEWQKELAEINDHYRKILKELENKKKKETKDLEKAVEEAEKAAKELEKAAKEAEKAAKESSPKQASVKKTGRTRCPSGTRRNKKTGNCEKKSAQTRKRCPNGTRRNKKTGNCE